MHSNSQLVLDLINNVIQQEKSSDFAKNFPENNTESFCGSHTESFSENHSEKNSENYLGSLSENHFRSLPDKLPPEIGEPLYLFSRAHDIVPIIGTALMSNRLITDKKICDKFKKEIELSTYRYISLNFVKEQLTSIFESEKIPFIHLKGTVLRKYYPEPYMRTSCDIDVLIRKEDRERAVEFLSEKHGYKTVCVSTNHDIGMTAPNGMNVELHYSLTESDKSVGAVLSKVWDYASLCDGFQYQYELSPEFFAFYHIAHMANHFLHGGIGIRSVLDFWILKNNMPFDREKTFLLLKSAGLDAFAEETERVSDAWFNNKGHSVLSKRLEEYIFFSGAYGNFNNLTEMREINNVKPKSLWKKIFKPYKELKVIYPIIEKHPVLTPLYQIIRWLNLLFFHRKHVAYELKTSVNKNNRLNFALLAEKLGLKHSD